MLFTVLTTLLAAVPAVAGPGAWFKVPNAPSAGYHSVSSKFYIEPNSTRVTGYYAAAQWSFQGHDVHYFGLQPRSPGSKTNGHLVYSVFGPGSTIGDPARCSGGADGGAGVSCALDINFDFGRWYTIESTVVGTKPDGSLRWNGTFIDDKGKRTYIASFWTNPSYGGLSGNVAQWLEWYMYNGDGKTPAQRNCQPTFQVHYGLPTGYASGTPDDAPAYGKSTGVFAGSIDDKCAVAANKNNYVSELNANGELVITAGILNKK